MSYDPKSVSIEWTSSGARFRGKNYDARNPLNRRKWYNNILEANGRTPLARLNKIPSTSGVKCNIYVKLEYLNVGGSLEDRAAIRMIEMAEDNGLKYGQTVVAPATGNMAISIALVCAVKGYKCVIVTPNNISAEVSNVLHALGASVMRTDVGKKASSESSHYAIATSYSKGIANGFLLDMNICLGNPLAHYESTAQEIVDALEGKVDIIVVPCRSGAAVTAISKYIKNRNLNVKVVAVDSDHSALSGSSTVHLDIPELGNDVVGSVAEFSDVSSISKASAKDSFLMARRLIREEGVMVGPSSGAAVVAALDLAQSLPETANVVVIGADGIRNYMRHFVDDEWLLQNKIIDKIEEKKVTPKDTFDPACLKYDPTTLAGEWDKNGDGKWSKCDFKFKPYRSEKPEIVDTVLDAIGNTPMVKLQKVPKMYGVDCNVFVKCEYLNAGGSVKDRIAVRMIELAEQEGKLKPGMTIIEPTSGNTGIGLSLAAAVKGYRCIIVMPVKMSKEKALAMESLGSIIVRTPNEAAFDSAYSHIGVALRLQNEIPGSIILDQYRNLGNPMAHYEQTAEEIIDSLDGKIDYVVVAAGTGGTVSGISKKIHEKIPNCKVIGVDPHGSILADPTNTDTAFYEVEGIGYDFVPGVLERSVVDNWFKSHDKESFEMARHLIREEGILCGGSSGTNVYAAMEVAKGLPKDANVVAVLPDGIRNYLTKFLSDEWMTERHFPVDNDN